MNCESSVCLVHPALRTKSLISITLSTGVLHPLPSQHEIYNGTVQPGKWTFMY